MGVLDMAMKGEEAAAHDVGVPCFGGDGGGGVLVDHSGIAFLSVWCSTKARDDKLGWPGNERGAEREFMRLVCCGDL
ncbi:hypothetical protein NL676_022906 [Syzygium grande]|nr:hypothetical protein NL676_022906 [Syzygium grande]